MKIVFFFPIDISANVDFLEKKTRLCILEHRVVLNIRVKYGGNTMKIPNSCKNLKNRLKLVNRVEGRKRIHGFEASLPEFLGKARRDLQELTIRISFNKNMKQRGGTESE